jgi:hypothetical protein
MLSDEQKDDLKKMGEKFYQDIDMDKYRPVPAEDAVPIENLIDLDHRKMIQIQKALDSGLQWEDLTEEEQSLMRK